jgi:hypothetical protein
MVCLPSSPTAETRFAAEGLRAYGDVIPSAIEGVRNIVIKQPIGVVGIITPWNCKLYVPCPDKPDNSPIGHGHSEDWTCLGGGLYLCHQGSKRYPSIGSGSDGASCASWHPPRSSQCSYFTKFSNGCQGSMRASCHQKDLLHRCVSFS